ncbi:MAG: hypothetical protein Ta2A_23110 [Treponemataceae bacterium]|nr:MAG: hypothetical protein Ta2A_23110 [Treponemataceae bacterium]
MGIFLISLMILVSFPIIPNTVEIQMFSKEFFNYLLFLIILTSCSIASFMVSCSYTNEYLMIKRLWFTDTISLKSIWFFTPYMFGLYTVIAAGETYFILAPFAKKQVKQFARFLKEKNPDCDIDTCLF